MKERIELIFTGGGQLPAIIPDISGWTTEEIEYEKKVQLETQGRTEAHFKRIPGEKKPERFTAIPEAGKNGTEYFLMDNEKDIKYGPYLDMTGALLKQLEISAKEVYF